MTGAMDHAIDPKAPDVPLGERLKLFAADIKVSHTVFAMPWAILSTFLAAGGWPKVGQLLLILVCMVTARTVAMGANRVLDVRLDALNPRTAGRALPSGRLRRGFVMGLLILCAAIFVVATGLFRVGYGNPWPLVFSVPVLAFVCLYPLLKRFTRLCHYYLGAALALAPVCAWVAISGIAVPLEIVFMALAVLTWTAGFDIIYACQDYESDRANGIFSVPSAIGIGPALWVARLTHAVCVAMLILVGLQSEVLGALYYVGVALAVGLLVVEHAIVRPGDLSKVNVAFFTVNGIISLMLGTLGVIDALV